MRPFRLDDPDAIPSPALLFDLDGIRANLGRMLELAGSPERLRPHMKTHKTREITKLYLDHGITRHKCATLMEAKVLAECGAPDVLLAYPMVGPNQRLVCELAKRFPGTRFSVLGDDPDCVRLLAAEAERHGVRLGLYVDVNVGQDRTGTSETRALEIAGPFARRDGGLGVRGIHLYDGHNTSPDPTDRLGLVRATAERGIRLRERLLAAGPLELVFGGTPAFLAYSRYIAAPDITFSPGTCILHDVGYEKKYPELGFRPAAAVLTRCVSRPGQNLITFDVGTKAICSDPPAGQRCLVQGLEQARAVLHNEEHLVLESDQADRWHPGAVTFAFPSHICPTVALYDVAFVAEGGSVVGEYPIAARGRLRQVTTAG